MIGALSAGPARCAGGGATRNVKHFEGTVMIIINPQDVVIIHVYLSYVYVYVAIGYENKSHNYP
jgi:hypothetical protein